MRHFLILFSLFCAALLVPQAASSAVTVGISDQNEHTFTSPLYAPLKLKVARYIAPYDVMRDRSQREKLDLWVRSARSARQRILISFEHSRTAGRERRVPSNAEYRRELNAFKRRYGSRVESISPWNEVNVCQKNGRLEGQPTRICRSSTGPKIVAGYYSVARSVFKGKKIVALDILDGVNVGGAVSYLRKFKREAQPKPTIWGIHNYSDTNRGATSRTDRLLREIGDSKAQIWLTETGGQLALAGRVAGEEKANSALRCMFTMTRRSSQIKRLYIYNYIGGNESFDGGLVSADGLTKRLGYDTVRDRTAGPCRPS